MISESENHIIGMIYEAVLQPETWEGVLQEIIDYTHSSTAIFHCTDQLAPDAEFVHSCNIPSEGLLAYEDERIKVIDMKLHAPLWNGIGVGEVIAIDWSPYANMQGRDEYLFYEKCLKPTHICYAGSMLLEVGKYRWAALTLHRSPEMTPYTKHELDILQRLGTHLRRALQIHRQMAAVREEGQKLHTILDTLKTGVILLDHQASLVYANARAKSLIEKSSVLWLDRYNRLRTHGHQQMQLDTYISSALQLVDNDFSQSIGGVLGLNEVEGQKPLMLSIVPFSKLASLQIDNNRGQQAAVFLTDANDKYYLSASFLKQQYGLSKREQQICDLFINGLGLEEIAGQCNITLSSTRTYFKYIFSKMNCSSQTALMHLLMSLTVSFEHIQ